MNDTSASQPSPASNRAPGASDQPAGAQTGPSAPMAPGDEAPQGTPGTGENICRDCGGSGQKAGSECPTCQGSGVVTVGIGGA